MRFGGIDRQEQQTALVALTRQLDGLDGVERYLERLEMFCATRDVLESAADVSDQDWLDLQLRRIAARSGLALSDYYGSSEINRCRIGRS